MLQSQFLEEYLVEQLAAPNVLHNKEDLGLGRHDLEQLHNIRVPDAAEDGDLALDVGDEPALEDLLLVDDLDGDVLPGLDVAGVVDLGEGAVAEELADLVPAEEQALGLLLGLLGFVEHFFFFCGDLEMGIWDLKTLGIGGVV